MCHFIKGRKLQNLKNNNNCWFEIFFIHFHFVTRDCCYQFFIQIWQVYNKMSLRFSFINNRARILTIYIFWRSKWNPWSNNHTVREKNHNREKYIPLIQLVHIVSSLTFIMYLSVGFHPGRCIYRVPEQTIAGHLNAHHPRHRGPAVNPYNKQVKHYTPIKNTWCFSDFSKVNGLENLVADAVLI